MKITASILNGYQPINVVVECNITKGLPNFVIVGLPSKSVDESRERIRAAILNSGYSFPKKRILINLAPADLPKASSALDLAIATSILIADKQINPRNLPNKPIALFGELSLNGEINPVKGIIGILKSFKPSSLVIIPRDNKKHAEYFASRLNIFVASTLSDVVNALNNPAHIIHLEAKPKYSEAESSSDAIINNEIDFADIIGQDQAKRALMIAASGGHNVLMSGPPGTGKSMLAKAFNSIMPNLSIEQSLETTQIHSIAGQADTNLIVRPPLRDPHHTASNIALIGGGHNLKPGEISLAHNGVLFLDEFPEFSKNTIESLRQPIEDKSVTIARAQSSTQYPCNFILIATANPCPCGFYGSNKNCSCNAYEINKYQKKLSGPILDRIDIHVTVNEIDHKELLRKNQDKISPKIAKAVKKCRQTQLDRTGQLNAHLGGKKLIDNIRLETNAKALLDSAAAKLGLSARSYIKTAKVARTIADMENSPVINSKHLAEALQFRQKPLEFF